MTFDTRTMVPMKAVHSASGLTVEDPMNVEFESVNTPLPSDILCGKNKICIKHEGSKSFRRIIESYTLQYQQASSRNQKMEVTKEIFDKLQTRRFLKYNEETHMWETLHPLAVRDKIGHALRFSNRKGSSAIRKQVRRSTSDMSSLRQADLASLRASASLGNMNALQAPTKQRQNGLRHSTGSLPFAGLLQQNAGSQQMQLGLPSLNALASMQNTFTTQVKLNPVAPVSANSTNMNDLSWMLQMPLMEMDNGKVYYVNGQPQQQQQASV